MFVAGLLIKIKHLVLSCFCATGNKLVTKSVTFERALDLSFSPSKNQSVLRGNMCEHVVF